MAPSSSSTSASSSCRRCWSFLPDDLLISTANVIPDSIDFVRFGATCKSWRSAATKKNYCKTRHMPWLMLAETSPKSKVRRFYSPSEDKVYRFLMPDQTRDRVCFGCTEGWIATVSKDAEVYLVNPFINKLVRLPSLATFFFPYFDRWRPERIRNSFIKKICLSSSPLKKNPKFLSALSLCNAGRPALVTPRSRGWITIRCKWWPYFDAIFHKGQFYLVSHRGVVTTLDPRRQLVKKISSRMKGAPLSENRYLVESSGELLQVARYRVLHPLLQKIHTTESFLVYKLLDGGEWERVENLGDKALFLGLNTSIAVVASELIGCYPNCIYFTDDLYYEYAEESIGRGHDMGVYNLADGSITKHYTGISQSAYSPPVWVPPFLWR